MSGVLRIVEPGLATTVQDRGRPGLQRFGVPPAGAVDPEGLALALALADVRTQPQTDAPTDEAALECRVTGPTVEAEAAPLRLAWAGAGVAMQLTRQDGTGATLEGWRSITLMPGDRLAVGTLRGSTTGYLALSGGIDLSPVMGSRATLTRAGLGGLDGRALQPGDRLSTTAAPEPGAEHEVEPPADWLSEKPVRVALGPQDDHFTGAALEAFLSTPWRIGNRSDRMGLRLEGPVLAHDPRPGHGADIVSDGIVTGAIQVPGSGQPILLLVDRQTSGGYAKIAAVIRADLPRLGRLGPGATIRFQAVDAREGARLTRDAAERLAARIAAIRPVRGGLDLDALYRENLITGLVEEP
ncbi:MAG: biotin-dependent carboxyltransferase family protein [Pseudomonadota bacterium]